MVRFSFSRFEDYAQYLTWFDGICDILCVKHPNANDLLLKGSISVARSLIPGNLCAVDKTMEETFMRYAKLKERSEEQACQVSLIIMQHFNGGLKPQVKEQNSMKECCRCVE